MHQIIVQGVGYIALLFVILSFQRNKRPHILLSMFIGLVLFVVHYSLLHAWTGALMNLIEAGLIYVAYNKETMRWAKATFWPFLFVALFVAAGLATYKDPVSFLPAIAQVFGTIAVWQQSPRTIRFLMLIPRPLWFTYNFVVGSQAGMVAEVFILLSVLSGIIRFDVLKRTPKPLL